MGHDALNRLEQEREETLQRLADLREIYDGEKQAGRSPDFAPVLEAIGKSLWAWIRLQTYKHSP